MLLNRSSYIFFTWKSKSWNIFYNQKMDCKNFTTSKKTFISISRRTKLYAKLKLQKSFIPKFYYNKPKKQAVKILWWCCDTNVSTVLQCYKLYSPLAAATIQISRNKSMIIIKCRVDVTSGSLWTLMWEFLELTLN